MPHGAPGLAEGEVARAVIFCSLDKRDSKGYDPDDQYNGVYVLVSLAQAIWPRLDIDEKGLMLRVLVNYIWMYKKWDMGYWNAYGLGHRAGSLVERVGPSTHCPRNLA